MTKSIDTFVPNPEYVGNTITFGEPTIDEQIENLKLFRARYLAELERDYHMQQARLRYRYHLEMQSLLEKKAEQENAVTPAK